MRFAAGLTGVRSPGLGESDLLGCRFDYSSFCLSQSVEVIDESVYLLVSLLDLLLDVVPLIKPLLGFLKFLIQFQHLDGQSH